MIDDNKRTSAWKRRQMLVATGSLATVGLAGCSGNGGNGGGDGGDGNDGGDGSDGSDGGDGDGGDGGAEFPSEDIRWIIPYSTGGGFDAYSRAIAEYMPDHFPTDVNIVPENVEGAGGRRGANEVYRADPDGHTVGILNIPGFVSAQLTQETEYDLREMSWIGRVASNPHLLVVRPDTGYETLSDLQNADETLRFATQGEGTIDYLHGTIGMGEMGIDVDVITGYDGSTEALTAAVRGDAELAGNVYSSVRSFVENGELRPIIAYGEEPPEYASDIPTVYDTEYEHLSSIMGLQRPVGGPPDVPDERIAILEEALLATLESDEMQQWSEDAGRPLAPAGREQTQQLVQNSIDTFEQFADQL